MPRNPSASRWLLLAAYPVVGLALDLADPALGQLAQQLGTKPGAATAVSVNLLMPLAAVILSLAVVRLWSAWLGAGTLTLGFLVGLALRYPARIPDGLSPGSCVRCRPSSWRPRSATQCSGRWPSWPGEPGARRMSAMGRRLDKTLMETRGATAAGNDD
jgi:hypothetical protein